MSARPAPRRRSLLASALGAAVGFLVEPAHPIAGEGHGLALVERRVIAVVPLAPRCGATTVARALGAVVAARDPAGACAVTAASAGGGALPPGGPAAMRLARALTPAVCGRRRTCGRVCLVEGGDPAALAAETRWVAPLVLDVADPAEAPVAVALADAVVLVGAPQAEPALAAVVAQSLHRVGPRPVVALNRARSESARWSGRADAELPESRVGAQLALSGREVRGRFGRAVAELADRLEGPA